MENYINIIKAVRNSNPLIHNITNEVVMNFTANGLLAFGGSPIMAKEKEEMESITSISDGLLINIGTALKSEVPSMIVAGKTANERQIPVVLDPVGVAASSFRFKTVKQLLNEISFTAIKGNAGEMAYLVDIPLKTKGVDSTDAHLDQLKQIAQKIADKYDTIAVVTGEYDVISNQKHIVTNDTGHPYLTKVTGAGCLLGSIVTACLTVEQQIDSIDKVYSALHFYGKAAERAAQHTDVKGSGTFLPYFIDELSRD